MRKTPVLMVGLLLGIILLTAWTVIHKKSDNAVNHDITTDSTKYERDILPDILAVNTIDKFSPPAKFKTGHVTDANLKNYLEKTADGFCIKLPKQTNVPTPAVVNGVVYLSGGFGSKQYYAFDAITGEKKWGINLDDDGPSSPAIEDNVIVFNTESCTIFGCDLLTGKMIWSYWLGDPLMSMPSISNGVVFSSYPARYPDPSVYSIRDTALALKIIPTHVLIAIELKTGKILWQKWIDSDIMSAPVAKNELLYVTTFSGALYKIKQENGEIIEAKAIRATSAPVFSHNNEVIVSRRSDNDKDSFASESLVIGYGVSAKPISKKRAEYLDKSVQDRSKLKSQSHDLDAGNGFGSGAPASSNSKVAHYNIGQSNVSSLQSFQGSRGLYNKGRIYNTMGDEIVCTDSSGNEIWKHALSGDLKKEGGFMGTPPVYANGYIIVATITGDVLIMDEKEGKVIKKYKVNDPVRYQPAVDKGWIYVTTTNGKMYAINTGDAAITGWNMWGGNAARTNVPDRSGR